jgi:hypothetical protein
MLNATNPPKNKKIDSSNKECKTNTLCCVNAPAIISERSCLKDKDPFKIEMPHMSRGYDEVPVTLLTR